MGTPASAAPLLFIFLAFAATAIAEGPPAPAGGTGGPAILHGQVTWKGTVTVTGDLEIAEDACLTVEPGTDVAIAAKDATGGGWDPKRIEIHVKGDLLVEGTPEKPVSFESPFAKPRPAAIRPGDRKPTYAWHGIVLWPPKAGHRLREIRGAVFTGAWSALQVPAGRVRVEDCLFRCCGIGVEAGSAYADRERCGMPGAVARPYLLRSRFAQCGTGVYAEQDGAPCIERCAMAACMYGAGNERTTGTKFPLSQPGVTATRCDFVADSIGLVGPSIATGNIFVRNWTGLVPSDYDRYNLTDVDFSLWTGNVFSGNHEDAAGSAGGPPGIVVEDPGYQAAGGLLDLALVAAGPPLPAGLALRDDSPARGKAPDGGDPGSLGRAKPPPAEAEWTSQRVRLRRPLAASFPAVVATGETGLGDLRPAAGDSIRDSWWCRIDGGEDGIFRPGAFGGGEEGANLALCYRVELPSAGPVELEVNGDLRDLRAWWNGEPLRGIAWPRRFASEGAVVAAAGKSGANLLSLRLRGRGTYPRFGVALSLPGGRKPRETEPPAEPREARITEARLVRQKDGTSWLRLACSTPVAWAPPGTAELLDAAGRALPQGPAKVGMEGPRAIRVGPLPEAALNGGSAVLRDFHGPDGAALAFPSEPVPVPAAPPK
jgi:hypothetical protein